MGPPPQRRRRRRWLARWILMVLLVAALILRLQHAGPIQAMPQSALSPPAQAAPAPPEERTPALQVGGYVTNISSIDLKGDTFVAELLVWTLWDGEKALDPSGRLTVLNSLFGTDSVLEAVRTEQHGDSVWTLYRLSATVVQRWRLTDYPFDSQNLHIVIGFSDPLNSTPIRVDERTPLQISPGLQLDGWTFGDANAYATSIRYLGNLGHPLSGRQTFISQRCISFDLELERVSLLYFAPDFMGYFLAIGLCSLSLVIVRSRDDLILAAVVSSTSNYVLIADKMPVSAMNGFIGNLQLILIVGILYVVGADEVIDQHLKDYSPRVATLLRYGILPSYLLATYAAIALIIP